MDENQLINRFNRFSIMVALVTLTLGLTYVVPTAPQREMVSIIGFLLPARTDAAVLIPVFIAILTLLGSIWFLSSHPKFATQRPKPRDLLPNAIIPIFTILVLAIILREMNRDTTWWIVFGLGTILFSLVLIAEYAVLDVETQQHPIATLGLISLSHGLFLMLSIALRAAEIRLYVVIPLIFIAATFVSFRTLSLRLNGTWKPEMVILICLIVAELAVAIYYLFITGIQYGLLLTGALYAFSSFATGFMQGFKKPSLYIEPLAMLSITIVMVIVSGLI